MYMYIIVHAIYNRMGKRNRGSVVRWGGGRRGEGRMWHREDRGRRKGGKGRERVCVIALCVGT